MFEEIRGSPTQWRGFSTTKQQKPFKCNERWLFFAFAPCQNEIYTWLQSSLLHILSTSNILQKLQFVRAIQSKEFALRKTYFVSWQRRRVIPHFFKTPLWFLNWSTVRHHHHPKKLLKKPSLCVAYSSCFEIVTLKQN